MKKLLIVIVSLFFGFEVLYAATYQPRSLGWVNLSIATMTLTAVAQSTPPTIGYPVFCYNCTASGGSGTICVSTESATAQNAFVLSTGTVCK